MCVFLPRLHERDPWRLQLWLEQYIILIVKNLHELFIQTPVFSQKVFLQCLHKNTHLSRLPASCHLWARCYSFSFSPKNTITMTSRVLWHFKGKCFSQPTQRSHVQWQKYYWLKNVKKHWREKDSVLHLRLKIEESPISTWDSLELGMMN